MKIIIVKTREFFNLYECCSLTENDLCVGWRPVCNEIVRQRQYDIFEVHEDEKRLMLKLISEDDGSPLDIDNIKLV